MVFVFVWMLKEQMVEPAVIGTKNVIVAAAEAKVRRVVFTSSIGAVYMDPNRSPDAIVDETCWSDLEFCKNTKVIYLTFNFSVFAPLIFSFFHEISQLHSPCVFEPSFGIGIVAKVYPTLRNCVG